MAGVLRVRFLGSGLQVGQSTCLISFNHFYF
jgi:hypothetical protein